MVCLVVTLLLECARRFSMHMKMQKFHKNRQSDMPEKGLMSFNMKTKTATHILDILRTHPLSRERDILIIRESTLVIDQMRVWSKHLQEALTESHRMKGQFGSDPVKTCEEGFLLNQCLAIGSLSR